MNRTALVVLLGMAGAGATGCPGVARWPDDSVEQRRGSSVDESWRSNDPAGPDGVVDPRLDLADAGEGSIAIQLGGRSPGGSGGGDGLFRNTYYDFPREGAGPKDATVFDASCAPIAKVEQAFHDQLCVQGSGRLSSGATVSFAKRDCACAAVCPRTNQRICYERLDASRFPNGRGSTGSPIRPLVTIAVDPAVIPLGTRVFVPEFVGLPRPDGSPHDGCFVAEDRGLRVVGRHIDVFTGDPAITRAWNAKLPSNTGVHVQANAPRCAR